MQQYYVFRQQWSTHLPFIHAASFLDPKGRPHASRTFLLAFLALTARFNAELVKLHSDPTDDQFGQAKKTSDYYYEHARREVKEGDERPTLERIQTLLMLGLYEWSSCRGIRAWQHIGTACRDAQLLGIFLDKKPERIKGLKVNRALTQDEFVEDEKRRRTFWACFIMDLFISGGPNRPANIHLEDVTIQLPCSELALKTGSHVRTPVLTADLVPPQTDTGEDDVPWERGSSESILCHYIRAMELWKRLMQWSVRSGRR